MVLNIAKEHSNLVKDQAWVNLKGFNEKELIDEKKRIPPKRSETADFPEVPQIYHDYVWTVCLQQNCLIAFKKKGSIVFFVLVYQFE
jgi:hypothetical protein